MSTGGPTPLSPPPDPTANPDLAARPVQYSQPDDTFAAAGSATSAAFSQPEATAFGSVGAHARFWIMALGGLALDLWSKHWAFETLRQDREIDIVPGVLAFKTMFNPGALFGIGAGRTSLFLLASVLALGLVLWMFAQSARRRWFLHIALGGILAGALGNMYDRMFVKLVPDFWSNKRAPTRYYVVKENDGFRALLEEYPPGGGGPTPTLTGAALEHLEDPTGYVRDFIKIETRVFNRQIWPWVFNVADMLLVGGVTILALHLLRDGRHPPARPPASDDPPLPRDGSPSAAA